MKKYVKNRSALVATALFLTFTICLYAPLSIFAANESEVWYNLRTIWYVPIFTFMVSIICSVAAGMFLRGRLYRIYLGFLFGLAVCFYAQGNFIGIKLPFMNGNEIVWSDYLIRMRINVAVWIAIIVAMVAIFASLEIMQKISCYVSLLFTGMQFVSLVVLLTPLVFSDGFASSATPALTTKGIYEVGSEDNIIVFVLDTYDEQYFDYVREENPDIIDDLDGFVYYDNYTSLYPTTSYSLLGLLNGGLFRNELSKTEWMKEKEKGRMYYDELVDNGYEVSLYTSELRSVPQRIREMATNYAEVPLHFYNTRTCFAIIYRLAACQYFPDIFKPYVWMDGTEISKTAFSDGEYVFFDFMNDSFKENLDKSGITVGGTKKYKFIHLYGAHEPYYTDELGNKTSQSWDWKASSKGCMRIVLDYMDRMKELGLYDKSTIIITADHGNEGYPGLLSNPIFMIKQPNSHGELEVCSFEAGHINFAATIADLAGATSTEQYGTSLLDITEDTVFDRYYYNYVWEDMGLRPTGANGNYYLVEYLTSNDSNDTSLFKLTDVEYTPTGEKIPHKQYCSKCQELNGSFEEYFTWDMCEHRHVKDFPY